MKLLDAIGKNLSLYQEMTQARVPYDFLKKQEKEVLLQFCKKVNQMHMGEIIAALQSEAIVYLIKDSVFLSFLLKLNCEDKIDTDRLSLLLAHAEENSLLSDYKYEELYRVLTDEHIFSEWKYEYLRYYSQYGFDDEQKTVLMYGLEKMRNFTEISLSELSESERMLLVKPFFKAGRINNIISERTIWRYLEQTEVQEILQTFSTDWRISSGLNLKQMEEIGSNADAILRDLKIVISYLPDDCLELFFERWMESEALVYDLKQFLTGMVGIKRIKMDTDDEIVYRTSQLYQRHKEIIQYIEENRLSVTAGELADKYPNINEILSGLDKKYEYGNEIFTVLAPHCIEDILKEGQALHHCIDKKTEYLERINEQETYILFLRKTEQPDKPYYTLEVEPGGVIRQKRTEYDRQNKDIEEASEFLKEWQREIQKRITASDKKLADKSRQLRIESYAEMRKKKVKINGGLFQGKYLADVLEADLMEMPDTIEHAA